MKKCYVIGAGEVFCLDLTPNEDDLVIAVDGGFRILEDAGIKPDLVIGDFDSLGFCPQSEDTIKLPEMKDDTDMFAALKQGIDKGYSDFFIYGGTGGRFDHTFANVQLLTYLSQIGRRGFMFSNDNVLTVITDNQIELPSGNAGIVSVFSVSENAYGVSERGLKYELTDASLTNSNPIGVSNEFTNSSSCIRVEKGTLLIIFPRDVNGLF